MTSIDKAEILADMLGKCSVFRKPSINSICRGLDYRIYIGVPVHCISLDGSDNTLTADYPNDAIDLLICRGTNAIIAVVFDIERTELEKLFSEQLRSLSYHFLKSEEMIDDVASVFCEEIERQILCDSHDPVYTGCKLRPLVLASAVSRMENSAVSGHMQGNAISFLKKKHLVNSGGIVTNYGHACGLFQQYIATGQGRTKYVTTLQSIPHLHCAMAWQDAVGSSKSLENRLSRLKQGLPVDTALQHKKTLASLLDTPLDKLFVHYEQDRQHLNILLSKAQFLSTFSKISAFGDREEIRTYGDVIYAVRNLWEYTAHGDCRNTEASQLCEDILAFLSFPLWSLPREDTSIHSPTKKKGLRDRLNRTTPNKLISSLVRLPLRHYFYAAASLTESEYPIWLYNTCVKPWLTLYNAGDSGLVTAMGAVYKLSQSDDENEQSDYFPLMYDILVEPFTGIV